jgi:sugar phosphate isomerase/epimerase
VALDRPFSIQLHSARSFPPITDHLPHLAALGYTNVEPTDLLYADPAALRETLDENGLTALSGHFPLDLLQGEPDVVCRIAETLGMRLVVCPFLPVEARPAVTDEWRRFGERLAGIARLLRSRGFDFAWHNHDYEFQPLRDGSLPIQHIAADPVVHLQIDVAWVALAGVDPKPWLEGYAGRIASVHVKDIAPRGSRLDEDGWADIGTGIVPWPKLWKTAIAAGASLLIAEHDNPKDFDRFARRSIDAMRGFASLTDADLALAAT